MRFWILFLKFYEIEKKTNSSSFKATIIAASQAYKTKQYHYKLIRDYKMTPAFYMANRYYTKAHDGAYLGLRLRFFKEMKKKQTARDEINTNSVDNLISTTKPKGKSLLIKKYFEKIIEVLKYTQKIVIKETEIKRPQSIKENLQGFLLYSVKLYHEALQSLIEGQREVLKDKKFVFEDNKTVDEKMKTFEEYLKEKIPRFRRRKEGEVPESNENKEKIVIKQDQTN